jgi:hypothetical protein
MLGVAAAQYPNRRLGHVVEFFCERAWPTLSIPAALQVDNAFVLAVRGGQMSPFNLCVRTALFFGVEVVVVPPNQLG